MDVRYVNVTKRFGKSLVVDQLNLAAGDGELVVLHAVVPGWRGYRMNGCGLAQDRHDRVGRIGARRGGDAGDAAAESREAQPVVVHGESA